MIIYATTYGIDSNPVNQVATMIENQEFNYYCTDVQVRGEYPAYAERMYQKYAVKDLVIEEGDLELLKEYPVDYIGFVIICRLLSMLLVLPTIQQMGIF